MGKHGNADGNAEGNGDEDSYEDDGAANRYDAEAGGEIYGVDNTGPAIHEDPTTATMTEEILLNHVKSYVKGIRRNPDLSVEEWDRRRRNATCYRCNKQGHMANQCPLPPPQSKKI